MCIRCRGGKLPRLESSSLEIQWRCFVAARVLVRLQWAAPCLSGESDARISLELCTTLAPSSVPAIDGYLVCLVRSCAQKPWAEGGDFGLFWWWWASSQAVSVGVHKEESNMVYLLPVFPRLYGTETCAEGCTHKFCMYLPSFTFGSNDLPIGYGLGMIHVWANNNGSCPGSRIDACFVKQKCLVSPVLLELLCWIKVLAQGYIPYAEHQFEYARDHLYLVGFDCMARWRRVQFVTREECTSSSCLVSAGKHQLAYWWSCKHTANWLLHVVLRLFTNWIFKWDFQHWA